MYDRYIDNRIGSFSVFIARLSSGYLNGFYALTYLGTLAGKYYPILEIGVPKYKYSRLMRFILIKLTRKRCFVTISID